MKIKSPHLIANRIIESEIIPGLNVFTVPIEAKQIVTIKGSLIGGDHFPPQKNKMAADTMVEMLDQGTKKYNKLELHNLLDSHGISIDFSISRFQINIDAHCLKEDTALTLELVAQILCTPTFPEKELGVVRKRMIGDIKERATDTHARAIEALTRKLYPSDNPNYSLSSKEEIAYMEKITRDDLLGFHNRLGLGKMYIVAVGDVETKNFESNVKKYFAGFRQSKLVIPKIPPTKSPKTETVTINIPDKTSSDVMIGTTIPFGDKHPDFYPMLVATNILGGGFTARLVQEIRDKKGLTYGTYAYQTGTGNNTPGYFAVWATFAPELLKKGVEALAFETKKFISKGVTAKELTDKKQTIAGSYKVSLSTTNGLATIILSNAEHDRPKDFIDEYPKLIERITLAQVNGTIKKYLDVKNLVTVIAGTV